MENGGKKQKNRQKLENIPKEITIGRYHQYIILNNMLKVPDHPSDTLAAILENGGPR